MANPIESDVCIIGGGIIAAMVATKLLVCDSLGRTHDHENLFLVGSLTLPNAGCTNGTLTFVALALRSADAIAAQFPKA